MVIVKDLSKLEKYGFHKCEYTQNTYEKVLHRENGTIALLVNPIGDEENNVIYAYAFRDEEDDVIDVIGELDTLFEMIQDGVIEYKK